jgi:hypothetical protein
MKPFSYTNKNGAAYYLHAVQLARGRTLYVARRAATGAVPKLPQGFEVRENVHGQVSVRRVHKRQLTRLEEQLIRSAMAQFRPFAYVLDVDGRAATIFASAGDRKCFSESLDAEFADGFADALTKTLAKRYSPELVEMFRTRQKQHGTKHLRYYPLLRFVISERKRRLFAVERVCFTGESSWVRLEVLPLSAAATKYLPHLGRDSFFDLI